MRKALVLSLFSIFFFCSKPSAFAQCDTVASVCLKNLTSKYTSDGQRYFSLLLDQEIAEFSATFYGGTVYRIAACSGLEDGNLIFSIYDRDRNLLYSNKDFRNAPYWDFKFKNTLDCTIEAELAKHNKASGCAVLLISFKK